MKVLIVHRYFWPEDSVAEEPLMLKDYVNWHLGKGHEVDIVFGSQDDYSDLWKEQFKSKLNFHYFISDIDRKLSFLNRILNSIRVLLLAARSILSSRKFDLIYVFSNPPLVSLFINILNRFKKKKSKVIFILQDNVIYRIKNDIVKLLFKNYLKQVVSLSDVTLTLSEPMKYEIESYFSEKYQSLVRRKVFVLVNFCFDLDTSSDDLCHKKDLIDIIYAGNHGPSQGLMSFLEVIANIKNHRSLKISFYGEGTQKEEIIKKSRKLDLMIKFHPNISRKEIKPIIAKSKFGLVSMEKSLGSYAFPSKLASYLSCGTKVIVSSNGEDPLKNYIEKNNCGFAVDSANPTKAAEIISQKLELFDERKNKISRKVLEQFDKNIYFKTLDKIIFD